MEYSSTSQKFAKAHDGHERDHPAANPRQNRTIDNVQRGGGIAVRSRCTVALKEKASTLEFALFDLAVTWLHFVLFDLFPLARVTPKANWITIRVSKLY